MSCKKCGLEKELVNKHFKLCRECNNERLYGNKFGKRYDMSTSKKKPLKRTKNKSRTKEKILKDEEFYEKCFNNSNHRCEECNKSLPKKFRNEDGRVLARFRYSHIVPKSVAPKLRHNILNINHLCLECHQEWENGAKHLMKIFAKNYELFPQFLMRWKSKL